ncbi:MAG: FtsH protease activity modulator HflK [Oxalobacter sp.]|nr:MAG: FtsH protease activity modulator HflK [Oxalobacter sp.]
MSRTLFNKIGATLSDLWGRGSDSEEEERSYRDKKRPPELDKAWQNFNERLNRLFGRKGGGQNQGQNKNPGNKGMGLAILILVVICFSAWLFTGLVIVAEGRVGLVMTFGKFTEVKQPGLSWRWPAPFQSVEIINKLQVRKIEIGYRGSEKNREHKESLVPTGDGNIVDIQVAVQYRLKNPNDWAFNNLDQEEAVKLVAESAIREVVGKKTMDNVLYEGRDKIAQEVSLILQNALDRHTAGVEVMSVSVQAAQAPEEVTASFDDAYKAEQDRKRMENESRAYADDVIPKAKGVATRLIQDAEAYRARVIAHAEGDTIRFKQILTEYQKAPALTRDRMYIETMQDILTKTTKVLVDTKNGGNMMYLPLDKLVPQPVSPSPEAVKPDAAPAPASTTTGAPSAAPTSTDKTPANAASVPATGNASASILRERDSRAREAR